MPNACQFQLLIVFRYSAGVVNKILSLATCQFIAGKEVSVLTDVLGGCPHPGAKRVSSPRSQAGVLTLESIGVLAQVRVDQYLNPAGIRRTRRVVPVVSSHTLMSLLCNSTSEQSISFAFSNFFSMASYRSST